MGWDIRSPWPEKSGNFFGGGKGEDLEPEEPAFAIEKSQDEKQHDEVGDAEQEGGQRRINNALGNNLAAPAQ